MLKGVKARGYFTGFSFCLRKKYTSYNEKIYLVQ